MTIKQNVEVAVWTWTSSKRDKVFFKWKDLKAFASCRSHGHVQSQPLHGGSWAGPQQMHLPLTFPCLNSGSQHFIAWGLQLLQRLKKLVLKSYWSRCCIPLSLKCIWNVCCCDDEAVEMCLALRWHVSSWLLKITPKNITLKDIFRVTLY